MSFGSVIEGLALRTPRPSCATIHRQVVDVAKDQKWPPPSYSSVYAISREVVETARESLVIGTL